jgi:hypothetical protein
VIFLTPEDDELAKFASANLGGAGANELSRGI